MHPGSKMPSTYTHYAGDISVGHDLEPVLNALKELPGPFDTYLQCIRFYVLYQILLNLDSDFASKFSFCLYRVNS